MKYQFNESAETPVQISIKIVADVCKCAGHIVANLHFCQIHVRTSRMASANPRHVWNTVNGGKQPSMRSHVQSVAATEINISI